MADTVSAEPEGTYQRGLRRTALVFGAAIVVLAATIAMLWAILLRLPVSTSSAEFGVSVSVNYGIAFGAIALILIMLYFVLGRSLWRAGAGWIVSLFVLAFLVLVEDFAFVYLALQHDVPNAFSQPMSSVDALYLAATTMTTVGGGGLYPTIDASRMAVTTETLLGVGVIGVGLSVLVARLVRSPG